MYPGRAVRHAGKVGQREGDSCLKSSGEAARSRDEKVEAVANAAPILREDAGAGESASDKSPDQSQSNGSKFRWWRERSGDEHPLLNEVAHEPAVFGGQGTRLIDV
ncbi:hypothetical protein GCM10025857_38570 [Alicyclobacillus contaminans]|nr:hypothetical protein GCM10025857_38570 [Alicyclobacillus contaminans]